MKSEEILYERLERLEMGEMLENILLDLPDEEGDLVYLAAQIRAIPKPERNPDLVKEQYRQVIRAVKQQRSGASRSVSSPLSLKWLFPVGLALFLVVAITGVWIGMTLFHNPKAITPASIASANNDVIHPGETQPIWGGTPVSGQIPTPNDATNPQTVSLVSGHGIVQVQNKNGAWDIIQTAELQAGQTFRTLVLSSAQMVFFDGSTVALGPNTQLTLETINASKQGPRQVSLFQSYGDTTHLVIPSTGQTSSYVVHTPNSSGEAKGTLFQVSVTNDENSSFAVTEGEVVVTGQTTKVNVNSGQVTYIVDDAPPLEPVSWINLQGEVSFIGDTWIIGGAEFQILQNTVVIGSPKIRDIVFVRGRRLPDNTYVADRIELYSPTIINRFRVFGVVEQVGVSSWTISGQEIHVNENTQIDHVVEIGNQVLVQGVVQEGGALLGTQIQLVEKNTHFEFTGLLEQMDAPNWVISSALVTINEETEITGDPVVGNLVHVEGQVLSDGTWLASEIKTVTETNHFEFIGALETIAPWVVDGISFEANEQTQVSPNMKIGDRVRVTGVILENGIWLANEIQLFEDEAEMLIFVGIMDDVNPWVLNGILLNITEDTIIVGDIAIASLVRVYIRILEDGTWQVLRVELIDSGPVTGCVEFSDTIASFDTDEIVLSNGITIPREVAEISGELVVGGEVLVQVCFGLEEEIVFASITVKHGNIEPTPPPDPDPTSGEKVTICHIPSGNPANAKTITVDASAVDAHLGHGDYLGACQDNGGNDKKDDKNDKNDKNDKGNGNK